jgi:hypothetical protein
LLHNRQINTVVLYYDSDQSPSAGFAGIPIATYASVGQRTLTIAPEKAPARYAAVIVIRLRRILHLI